jgi:tetratricopeptide (TPR) repeat protein
VDQRSRDDLLDLAILSANLHVALAASAEASAARRDALDTFAEAEALLGPSRALYEERRIQALALGHAAVAAEAERKAAALAPRGAWEHYALGRAYLQAGDLRRAAEQLDRALSLEPNALWPNFARGLCALRSGEPEDALVAFSACVALAPHSAACFCNRGRAYAELRRFDRARQDFEHALRLDPTHQPARELLAGLK